METADIGGAWILETVDSESCDTGGIPTCTAPEVETPISSWIYVAVAAIAGVIVGYTVKGSK